MLISSESTVRFGITDRRPDNLFVQAAIPNLPMETFLE